MSKVWSLFLEIDCYNDCSYEIILEVEMVMNFSCCVWCWIFLVIGYLLNRWLLVLLYWFGISFYLCKVCCIIRKIWKSWYKKIFIVGGMLSVKI